MVAGFASAELEAVLDRADAVDLDAARRRRRASQLGGLKPMPTPDGVPVAITSPG